MMGTMLKETERAKGGQPYQEKPTGNTTEPVEPTLKDPGVTKREARSRGNTPQPRGVSQVWDIFHTCFHREIIRACVCPRCHWAVKTGESIDQ